jgi:hypothetical protein
MYNPAKGFKPEQAPPEVDEGAGVDTLALALGQHLEVSVLPHDKR